MDRLEKVELVLVSFLIVFVFVFLLYLLSPRATGLFISNSNTQEPHDFVSEDKIKVEGDKVIFELENAVFSRYLDTGSMLPTLGAGSTGVGFKPRQESEIHIGDIVSFKQEKMVVVHRIVEIGKDEAGIYFITKGDNNFENDRKIRFEDIESVLVAIIY